MKHFYFKNLILLVFAISFVNTTSAQEENNFWHTTTKDKLVKNELNIRKSEPIKSQFFNLNINDFNLLTFDSKRTILSIDLDIIKYYLIQI